MENNHKEIYVRDYQLSSKVASACVSGALDVFPEHRQSSTLSQPSDQVTLLGTSRNVENFTSNAQNSTHTLQPGRVASVSVYLKSRRRSLFFFFFFLSI